MEAIEDRSIRCRNSGEVVLLRASSRGSGCLANQPVADDHVSHMMEPAWPDASGWRFVRHKRFAYTMWDAGDRNYQCPCALAWVDNWIFPSMNAVTASRTVPLTSPATLILAAARVLNALGPQNPVSRTSA